jgi:hypothetical protein
MRPAVFRVSDQYRVAVTGLKPIDIAQMITGLMTVATPITAAAALAGYPQIHAGRGTTEGVP